MTPGSATINAVGPNDAIPVTAILLDKNGNGYLDQIDIVYPNSVTLLSALPSARLWVTSAGIVSYDGNTPVTLVIDTMYLGGRDTIHIVLRENSGPTLETGWPAPPAGAHVTLAATPMTTEQRAFTVTNIIDGAAPVIKSLCFVPSSAGDTLHVLFSEPVAPANLPSFTITSNGTRIPDTTTSIVNQGQTYLYIYHGNTLTDIDVVNEPNRPRFPVELCGGVPIIADLHVATNPFTPGRTPIPPSQQDPANPVAFGTRIEVTLIKAIQGDLQLGKVTGTISIIDAVGNTVLSNEPMSKDLARTKIFKTWNGKTSKGNIAGGGTYMAKIVITDQVRNTTDVRLKPVAIRQQ
jgi:hypothetical protein